MKFTNIMFNSILENAKTLMTMVLKIKANIKINLPKHILLHTIHI